MIDKMGFGVKRSLQRLLLAPFVKLHGMLHSIERAQANRDLRSRLKAIGEKSRIEWPSFVYGAEYIEIGAGVRIAPYCRVDAVSLYGPSRQRFSPCLKIGDGVSMELFCHIAANHRVEIGIGTMIAGRVFITDHYHEWSDRNVPVSKNDLTEGQEVIIGDYCFIGEGAVILPGVHLGHHCVVGANAVVTKDFPPYSIIAGVPARVIRRLRE